MGWWAGGKNGNVFTFCTLYEVIIIFSKKKDAVFRFHDLHLYCIFG